MHTTYRLGRHGDCRSTAVCAGQQLSQCIPCSCSRCSVWIIAGEEPVGEQVAQVGGEALVQACHQTLQGDRSLEPHVPV